MKPIVGILLLSGLMGCTTAPSISSKVETPKAPSFSEIVKRDATTKKFCPESKEGQVCLMTWLEAMAYCQNQGAHLPTAREYANLLKPRGTEILEAEKMSGTAPEGFYLVDSHNPDGSRDTFYMSHKNYRRPVDEKGNHLLWTASIPPLHPQYAHVYYDEWGGGGGNPKDHMLGHRNAVRCAK